MLVIGIVGRSEFFGEKSAPWDKRIFITDKFLSVATRCGVLYLPILTEQNIDAVASLCDGLIVPGTSWNVFPEYYGEHEDGANGDFDQFRLDRAAIEAFVKQEKPILGVCGGHQSLNVFFGGTLNRHLPERHAGQMHEINIMKGSFLDEIYKKDTLTVNSYHFQGIKDIAPGFKVAAVSDDGYIEAIEKDNIFAVQFHPEAMDDDSIFKYFFSRVPDTKKAKCDKKLLGIRARREIAQTGTFKERLHIMSHFNDMAECRDVILFPITDTTGADYVASICDALIVSGFGPNIYPSYYGEEPQEGLVYSETIDEFKVDKEIIPQFLKQNKPIFGICGGIQSINVFFGGSLVQRINVEAHLAYKPDAHPVSVIKGSFLDTVFGKGEIMTNTFHGQSVKTVAPGFRVSAISHDGVIEAIESEKYDICAVQWHPEVSYDYVLFDWFLNKIQK